MVTDNDRIKSKENHLLAQQALNSLTISANLTDIWRVLHPNVPGYTWKRRIQNSDEEMSARLDYFLCSDSIVNRVVSMDHCVGYQTDHALITMKIQTGVVKRGRGFWKFNTKNLNNKEYVEGAKRVIGHAKYKFKNSNPAIKWEMIKCELIAYTRSYSAAISANRNLRFETLNKCLNFLANYKDPNPEVQLLLNMKKTAAKAEMDRMLQQQVITHAMLSKTKWYAYGERSCKYFYSLAKSKYNAKTMQRLQVENGNIITDPTGTSKIL